MDELIVKYHKELIDVEKSMWKQYAEALDLTIEYIKSYDELDDSLRIPCVYVATEIHLKNGKFDINNIKETIIKFLDYYSDEYEKYMNGFALITDQEYADVCFYDEFIKKHQELPLQQ